MRQQVEEKNRVSPPIKPQNIRVREAYSIGEEYVNASLAPGTAPQNALPLSSRITSSTRAPIYVYPNDVCIQRVFIRLLVDMFDISFTEIAEELGVSKKKITRWIRGNGDDRDNLDVPYELFDDCLHSLLNYGERAKYYDRLGLAICKMNKTPYPDLPFFSMGDPDEEAMSYSDREKFYDQLIAICKRNKSKPQKPSACVQTQSLGGDSLCKVSC